MGSVNDCPAGGTPQLREIHPPAHDGEASRAAAQRAIPRGAATILIGRLNPAALASSCRPTMRVLLGYPANGRLKAHLSGRVTPAKIPYLPVGPCDRDGLVAALLHDVGFGDVLQVRLCDEA